ncbi:hypothetical protein [Clostridium sp. ZBS12]|nr:hypothetical protein [Clostridium sp. ZBS12]
MLRTLIIYSNNLRKSENRTRIILKIARVHTYIEEIWTLFYVN